MVKMATEYSCLQTEGINLKISNEHPWKKWNTRKLRLKLESLGLNNTGKWTNLVDRLSQYYQDLQIDVLESFRHSKNRQFWCGFRVFEAQYYSVYKQEKWGCPKVALTALKSPILALFRSH